MELAEAAVFTDLALVLLAASFFLPLGLLFFLAAMAPFGIVAARRRLRTVVVMGAVAVVLSTVVLGPSGPGNMVVDVACGGVAGWGLRRGWSGRRTLLVGVPLLWVPAAALSVAALTVFGTARHLAFAQLRSVASGVDRFVPGAPFRAVADAVIAHWQPVLAAAELVLLLLLLRAGWALTVPLVRRLAAALRPPHPPPADAGGPPAPVPVRLEGVAYRYPGGSADAVAGLDAALPAGGFVAVTGPNGAGKSTFGLLLAGLPPTRGRVVRPGPAGLGRPGGTAVVGQRPDSQVLGVLVRDDVVWGLPDPDAVDVPGLLAAVGLAGFADRETATLSGGQLQRLAVAAALARTPRLLVSDESTSMLDPDGRAAVVALLRRLADSGVTVVHVTHRPADAAAADTVLQLGAGEPA